MASPCGWAAPHLVGQPELQPQAWFFHLELDIPPWIYLRMKEISSVFFPPFFSRAEGSTAQHNFCTSHASDTLWGDLSHLLRDSGVGFLSQNIFVPPTFPSPCCLLPGEGAVHKMCSTAIRSSSAPGAGLGFVIHNVGFYRGSEEISGVQCVGR